MQGRLKLLDNFEGLLERPILQDELEKKYNLIIAQYKDDGLEVQNIFQDNKVPVSANEDDAPIFQNIPPVTGAIYWADTLRQRLREPMIKLRLYSEAVREVPEDFREIEKLYASLMLSSTSTSKRSTSPGRGTAWSHPASASRCACSGAWTRRPAESQLRPHAHPASS